MDFSPIPNRPIGFLNKGNPMGPNPATGEEIKIPAKTVVKMRVAKAGKEAIVPGRKYGSEAPARLNQLAKLQLEAGLI